MSAPTPFHHNILRLNARCPSCSSQYDLQRLKILGEREQQVLAYIDCSTCGTALLSILSMGQNGMTAQGLVVDLMAEEVTNLDDEQHVTSDDVVDMHELLGSGESSLFSSHR